MRENSDAVNKVIRDCQHKEMDCSSCPEREACKKCIADGMLIDCKSFYYVFRYLDEETRVPVYTGDQKQYETAIDDYFKKSAARPCLQIPKSTNGAFAAELALKYLYFRENKRYGGIHGLYELFYGLPEIHRAALINRIKHEAHQTEKTIEEQLKTISNAFVKSRYFFEHDTAAFTGLFDSFVKIVCDYAITFDDKEKQNTDHTEKCCFDNKTRTGSRG